MDAAARRAAVGTATVPAEGAPPTAIGTARGTGPAPLFDRLLPAYGIWHEAVQGPEQDGLGVQPGGQLAAQSAAVT